MADQIRAALLALKLANDSRVAVKRDAKPQTVRVTDHARATLAAGPL